MTIPFFSVTFNYRLGVFGFLATDDKAATGNYGIMDQIMALKWVQKNIAKFGGDPNAVTIFGEDSGAASATILAMSPLATGLFHRYLSWIMLFSKRKKMLCNLCNRLLIQKQDNSNSFNQSSFNLQSYCLVWKCTLRSVHPKQPPWGRRRIGQQVGMLLWKGRRHC